MKKEILNIEYCIKDLSELNDSDRILIDKAIQATSKSYNKYSHFAVGAAIMMSSGNIVVGTNQENIAYPSGLCAERTALFSSRMQEGVPTIIAIAAKNEKNEIATAYPCGACRQVMMEFQNNISQKNIKVLILKEENKVLCLDSIEKLLPFSFDF